MQALILAAGMGRRLKELTKENTKCMVKVAGVTLIDRMLHQIEKHEVSRVVIVVGYEGQKLIDYISTLDIKIPVTFIENPIYDKTNNIYSLALARNELIQDDTLLLESDLIFEDSVLDALVNDPRENVALVDKYESWMDGTCVRLSDDDSILSFVSGKEFKFSEIGDYYKTVNISKFSKDYCEKYYAPFLDAYEKALKENRFFDEVLKVTTILDVPRVRALRLQGQMWFEINDIQDLDLAETLFTQDPDEMAKLIQGRFGGYWRYPKMLDYNFLVNPYFPPQKMLDEMKANFDTLVAQYPSGMRVNSLLAARNFGIHAENIVVGNGTAELIKSLMSQLHGRTGFVRPTFEEYPNRYNEPESISFIPENKDYSYTADDVMNYFEDKEVSQIVIVNPDNPSGNYIAKKDLLRLIDWTKEKNIGLVIDESFADFADEPNNTLIESEILEPNPHLYVLKSISKTYGVPGLRLGVLASGDMIMIARMKKDVAIWNINSIAEFYMQIEEKYAKDYDAAMATIRAERKRFQDELGKIEGLRVIPSQANYIMVELTYMRPRDLLKTLLFKHQILIKDLSNKTNGGKYVRLAVRNTEDNDKLLAALKEELG